MGVFPWAGAEFVAYLHSISYLGFPLVYLSVTAWLADQLLPCLGRWVRKVSFSSYPK